MEERATPLKCYSRLRRILFERGMTVMDLERGLAKQGIRVNPKTLYRLNDPTESIQRLETAIVGHICEILGVDLSRLLAFEAMREEMGLRRLSPGKQRRLDALLELQAEEQLNSKERRELQDLVDEAERLTAANAKMLARARTAAARS